jgi:hypothetical protein
MTQEGIKIECRIRELEVIAEKARTDYESLPDDGSEFPVLTPMKELKLKFLNLSNSASDLAEVLSEIQKKGEIV